MVAVDLERVVEIANGLVEAPHWPKRRMNRPSIPQPSIPTHPPARIAMVAEQSSQRSVIGFLIARL